MTENGTEQTAVSATETAAWEAVAKRKRPVWKMLLLVAIVLGIVLIWFAKNVGAGRAADEAAEDVVEAAETASAKVPDDANADFTLEAETIDIASLLSYELPIVIDFGSDSCIPCQKMAPILKNANAEYQGKAIIKFVDVWKDTDAAYDFPVQVIPTQVFISADGTPYVPSKDLGIEFGFYSDKVTKKHLFTVHQGGLTEEQLSIILSDMGVSE